MLFNMDVVSYGGLLNSVIARPDRISTNRKGDTLFELLDAELVFFEPIQCFLQERKPSLDYLEKELAFYLSGSDRLSDATKCSKFWEKCSDDGRTINSNYGKLLFHDINRRGSTQFEYALSALVNNRFSKKAVMVLHSNEHAYISNDNPCTMNIQFMCIRDADGGLALNMTVNMRSCDLNYGLPYDAPFFSLVWKVMQARLHSETGEAIKLGIYRHRAGSLHLYEKDVPKLQTSVFSFSREDGVKDAFAYKEVLKYYTKKFLSLDKGGECLHKKVMRLAWKEAEESPCKKKKCGCVIIDKCGFVIASGYGGAEAGECVECVRDAGKEDAWHGDSCPSVHAEMRAVVEYLSSGVAERAAPETCTVYTTHGPCDACLKLLDFAGFRKLIYDKPYKTDYTHWPRIDCKSLEDACKKGN